MQIINGQKAMDAAMSIFVEGVTKDAEERAAAERAAAERAKRKKLKKQKQQKKKKAQGSSLAAVWTIRMVARSSNSLPERFDFCDWSLPWHAAIDQSD